MKKHLLCVLLASVALPGASAMADGYFDEGGEDRDSSRASVSDFVESDGAAGSAHRAKKGGALGKGSLASIKLEDATSDDTAAAVGHFARTRSLLIAAINEFDAGTKLANPESLIDPRGFREALIGKAEELERVLDPQPRITNGGIKYNGDSRLLNIGKK